MVDEDPVVRLMLQRELGAAGYEVDTLSSGNGFTGDVVALIRPDVLLVDPFIGDVPLPAVEELLLGLRKDGHLVLLLIDSGRDSERLRRIAAVCHADGQIPKRVLLAAPASTVGDQLLPEAAVEGDLDPRDEFLDLPTAEMAILTGEEIVLEEILRPARVVGPALAPKPQPRRVPSRPDLLALIEEELEGKAIAPIHPQAVQVQLNLFSRHNFYVGSTGDLRSGGIFVATALLPKAGTIVPVHLELPFSVELKTEAPVEWVRESSQMGRVAPGVGLSLAHLPEAQRQSLEQFFRERAPLTYLPNRK